MNIFFRSRNVLCYIVGQNPWYVVPFRVLWSVSLLFFQYMTKSVVSIRLFNGTHMILFPQNAVSSMFLYTDIPDKEEIMLLRSDAYKNTVFLDIGAHIGSYSLCLADKVKKTIAFEPSPEMANRCRMNFAYNGISVNNVEQTAISSINGSVRFTKDSGETENHITVSYTNTISVESLTLDTYAKKMKLSKSERYLVKIDVEGGETDVVQGAARFFTSYTVDGILYESFGKNAIRMETALKSKGFTVRRISENNYYAAKI